MPETKTLEGRVALVTGAASGIGAQAARLLAAHGAKVAAADLDFAGAKGIVSEFGGHAIEMDVTSEPDWQRTVAEIAKTFGRLDVLVNCAGIELVRTLGETTYEDWRRVMAVNLDGVFLGTRAALPAMRKGALSSTSRRSPVSTDFRSRRPTARARVVCGC